MRVLNDEEKKNYCEGNDQDNPVDLDKKIFPGFPGYIYHNEDCLKCPSTCTKCSGFSTCTQCKSKHSLKNNRCVK